MSSANLPITLVLTHLPQPAAVGVDDLLVSVQLRQTLAQTQTVTAATTLTFDANAKVAPHKSSGAPNFTGPYCHGTPADRFIYLVWEVVVGNRRERIRRTKIKLKGLDWEMVEAGLTGRLQVTLDCRSRDAGPISATPPASQIQWAVVAPDG